jgi:uncharacterized membrane protein YfcA
MHLQSDQPPYDENSRQPRLRLKRADIQVRKLGIGIGAIVVMVSLFILPQTSPSFRKIFFLWLVGTIAFYFCFAKLLVYSYEKDKRKLQEKGDQPPH